MRPFLSALFVAVSVPAMAQSLDGSLGSGLQGALGSGLNGGIQSGLESGLGSRQQGRTRARLEENGFAGEGACAPGQFSLNNSGCRPAREFGAGSITSYDTSIQAMRPLGNTTLQGLTLDPGPEISRPLD